jgi:hypothetical protein
MAFARFGLGTRWTAVPETFVLFFFVCEVDGEDMKRKKERKNIHIYTRECGRIRYPLIRDLLGVRCKVNCNAATLRRDAMIVLRHAC